MNAIDDVTAAIPHTTKTFRPSKKEELVQRIGEISSFAHRQLVDAMCTCVGLQDKDIKEVTLRPKTGEFEFTVTRPLMGRTLSTSKEAPGGVILQLGFNPITGKGEIVKGKISKDSLRFYQGVSSYVISSIDNLEGANKTMAKMVTLMPKFINRKIFKNAGFDYNPKDGSLSGPVQVKGVTFQGKKILQSFSLFGGGDRKPADKACSLSEVLWAWRRGEPLKPSQDYKAVLEQRYREAMAGQKASRPKVSQRVPHSRPIVAAL